MKQLSLLILILAISTSAITQDWDAEVYRYGEQYPGYIIDAQGKKHEGYIKYTDRVQLQERVEFYTEKGNRKTREKYKTKDLQAYKMADKEYHVIHYSGGLLKKPVRGVLLVEEACISQYVWYNKAENFSMLRKSPAESDEEFDERRYPRKALFLNRNNEYPIEYSHFAFGFRKKMAELVSDNKELVQKIENKEKGYGLLNIPGIIEEYNQACENSK